MLFEKVYLYPDNENIYMDVYLCNDAPEYKIHTRPMMLICPGGGYQYCSPREAEPIARAYMADGYNTAVLYYSTKDNTDALYNESLGFSKPHYEVSKAICTIRDNAEKWKINPDQIAVIGFSAGAHLAGCSAFLDEDEALLKVLGCAKGYNKPNAVILCYPVISTSSFAHKGSFVNLLGTNPSEDMLYKYSLEKHVTSSAPPVFLLHTSSDKSVSPKNSTCVADALLDAGVNFEMHIFPLGIHGISLANREVLAEPSKYDARWLKWSLDWLETIFNF